MCVLKQDEAWWKEPPKVGGRKKFDAVKQMPVLNPEPNYIIRTRPPMWDD